MASFKSKQPKKVVFLKIPNTREEGEFFWQGPYGSKPTSEQRKKGGEIINFFLDKNGDYIKENEPLSDEILLTLINEICELTGKCITIADFYALQIRVDAVKNMFIRISLDNQLGNITIT